MSGRGLSARKAHSDALDRVFAAGDAVAEAKEARARAREAYLPRQRKLFCELYIYRQNAERVAAATINRGLGGFFGADGRN
jgi:hypothetical protein